MRGAAKLLESLGHKVEPNFPAVLDDATLSSAFGRVVAGGVARQAAMVETMLGRAVGPDDFDEWTWFLVERGRRLKLVDYLAEWAKLLITLERAEVSGSPRRPEDH